MKLESPIQDTDLCSQQSVQADNCSVNYDGTSHSTDMDNFDKAQKKTLNVYDYELNKKKKTLNKLMNKIEKSKNELKALEKKVGHFGVRNVNKRDEKARITRQALRESKAHVRGLTKIIGKLQNVKEENKQLALENEILKKKLDMLNEKKLIIDSAENKKLNAQKSASYYKMKAKKLHQQIKSGESPNIDKVKHILVGKNQELHNLQVKVEMLMEELNEKHCTKNSDGSYTDNVRLCVIELAALEVATEKISPAIEVVSRHIFSREIEKNDLPNSTSVQTIVNEGHYLAKAFIAAKLDTVRSWGLNRDGTTRKKKKIVDTSITLDSGDVISLGFTRVAHENAKTIHDVTKKHITELAQLKSETSLSAEQMKKTVSESVPIPQHTPIRNNMCQLQTPSRTINTSVSNDFITDSLSKLAFTMCDRASNEKLADKLLDQWRDEVLNQCDDDQKQSVLHFHCMAHILLGFHKYACVDLKSLESTIFKESGRLGRDALPQFKFWTKKETYVERVARTVSDTFGPVGDHYGLRDRWEAYCSQNRIKSLIGSYRDNRFNSLFQTAAEVLLHAEDIMAVIDTVTKPNQKLVSVQADLKCDIIKVMLQCFGLLYIKVTGPYWNLVTMGEVPYLLLYIHIQDLASFLKQCSSTPETLLNPEGHWKSDDTSDLYAVPHHKRLAQKLFVVAQSTVGILHQTNKTVTSAMLRTVENQLVDFLPGGKYSKAPSKADLKRTSFSHSTNLGCEHHFGDLDSSQKRRPNASMHHHTTVQLLKRNRKSLIHWLSDMPSNKKEEMLKKARKGGRVLREQNMNAEKEVEMEINRNMIEEKENPRKRRKTNGLSEIGNEPEEDYDCITNKLPVINEFSDNEYIAVAYQDQWYPGCVIKSSGPEAIVKFEPPCRQQGYFIWPAREDIQSVKKDFVLKRGFLPDCVNSGRQWYFKEHCEIDSLFKQYQNKFF